jgi:hypothetical protein
MIPDVREGKGERSGTNRPIVHFEWGFFRGEIPEIHPWALVDREPVVLDAGQEYFGKTNIG